MNIGGWWVFKPGTLNPACGVDLSPRSSKSEVGSPKGLVSNLSTFFHHQTMLDGIRRQGGGIVQIQLVHYIGPVFFDRFDADMQHIGNFFILKTFAQQFQDLSFALGDGVPGGFGFQFFAAGQIAFQERCPKSMG